MKYQELFSNVNMTCFYEEPNSESLIGIIISIVK